MYQNKSLSKKLVYFSFFLCISCFTVFSEETRDIRKLLTDYVDVYKKSYGVVAGIIDKDNVKFYAYGKASQEDTNISLNEDTIFEIGSITKLFTASLLELDIEGKKISLNTSLDDILHGKVTFNDNKVRKITMEQLSTHTSGLPRMPTNINMNFKDDSPCPFANYSIDNLYDFLKNSTIERPQQSAYLYSNVGYGILGYILTVIEKQDFETLCTEHITKPLNMKDTIITLTTEQKKRFASGYDAVGEPVPHWEYQTLQGAGALRSTARDLTTFLKMYLGLLPSTLTPVLTKTFQVRKETGTSGHLVSLGWHISKLSDGELYWHDGETGGFSGFIGFDNLNKKGIVLLANSNNSLLSLGLYLLNSQQKLFTDTLPKIASFAADSYKKYTGEYILSQNLTLKVSVFKDNLVVQLTGNPKLLYLPEAEHKFFNTQIDSHIEFQKDAEGKISLLLLKEHGVTYKAYKDTQKNDFADALKLPKEKLEQYIGKYVLKPNYYITIKKDETYLTSQVTGQAALRLKPIADNKFETELVDSSILFHFANDGKVDSLTVYQGAITVTAKKVAN